MATCTCIRRSGADVAAVTTAAGVAAAFTAGATAVNAAGGATGAATGVLARAVAAAVDTTDVVDGADTAELFDVTGVTDEAPVATVAEVAVAAGPEIETEALAGKNIAAGFTTTEAVETLAVTGVAAVCEEVEPPSVTDRATTTAGALVTADRAPLSTASLAATA